MTDTSQPSDNHIICLGYSNKALESVVVMPSFQTFKGLLVVSPGADAFPEVDQQQL